MSKLPRPLFQWPPKPRVVSSSEEETSKEDSSSEEEKPKSKSGDTNSPDECQICMGSNSAYVECACGQAACVECHKTFICGSQNPAACLFCGTFWSGKFVIDHFGGWESSNAKDGYRTHIKRILFEKEKARREEVINFYGDITFFPKLFERLDKYPEKIEALRDVYMKRKTKRKKAYPKYIAGDMTEKEYNKFQDGVQRALVELRDAEYHYRQDQSLLTYLKRGDSLIGRREGQLVDPLLEEEKDDRGNKVACPCPYYLDSKKKDQCKGLMIHATDGEGKIALKCAVFEKHTLCKRCREPLNDYKGRPLEGEGKGGKHKCKKETVESINLIKSDTKPCPTCGTAINRISGCDSMWCTRCHMGFNYRTGKVERTTHNPHLIDWQMQNGAGVRTVGDIPCGGVIDVRMFNQYRLFFCLSKAGKFSEEEWDYERFNRFVDILNLQRELVQRVEDRDEVEVPVANYFNLMFMLGKIDETEFKNSLFRVSRETARENTRVQITETFSTLLIERIRNLLESYHEIYSERLAALWAGEKRTPGAIKMAKKFVSLTDDFFKEVNKIRKWINDTFREELKVLGSNAPPYVSPESHIYNRKSDYNRYKIRKAESEVKRKQLEELDAQEEES